MINLSRCSVIVLVIAFSGCPGVGVPDETHVEETGADQSIPLKLSSLPTWANYEDGEIDIWEAALTPNDLYELPLLQDVGSVVLRRCVVTRDHLIAIAERFPHLRRLNILEIQVEENVLSPIRKMPFLVDLDIGGSTFNDEALVPLRGLPLERIRFSNNLLTDSGMEVIGTLLGLRELDVHETSLTDQGVQHLALLSKMEHLNLGYTDVGDDGARIIATMSALKRLFLSRTRISDQGVNALRPLKNLEWVDIGNHQLTDACLDAVVAWPNLETLSLFSARITDAGVAKLKQCRRLAHLDLGTTKVTDQGLLELETLPLTSLRLNGTNTSNEGIGLLKRSIRGLVVSKYGVRQ